jgi:two-component system, chemotaxis family, sensor kinase Cph1
MDLKTLTNEQLHAAFQKLQAAHPGSADVVDRVQDAMHELQIHRLELEMQNRQLRATQEELEQTILRYTDLYDYSPIGYLTLSPHGRIEEANLTAAEIFNCQRKELIGSFLRKFLVARDADRFAAHAQDCLQKKTPGTLEVEVQPANRAEAVAVQLSTRVAKAAQASEPQLRTTLTDITALKRTQQTLLEINREQENFAHSISHDLRAPLVTISNFSSLLLKENSVKFDDTTRDFAERIHNAAVRMDQLLRDLLEYSRLSRAEIKIEAVDLEAVIDDVIAQHRGKIEESGGTVAVERPLPRGLASRQALGQALANLLTNALKYTQPGKPPAVSISARRDQVGLVTITVADQGIGIPPEHHDRIFRLFERLHGAARFPGTGIGLALVRRAVERMGGRVWLESEVGQGSRFHLELREAEGG